MEDLINELRLARKKRKITQSELARSVNLPQSHISDIEQGKIDLRISTLMEIARILDHEVMLVPRQFYTLVKAIIEEQKNLERTPLWQPDKEKD